MDEKIKNNLIHSFVGLSNRLTELFDDCDNGKVIDDDLWESYVDDSKWVMGFIHRPEIEHTDEIKVSINSLLKMSDRINSMMGFRPEYELKYKGIVI